MNKVLRPLALLAILAISAAACNDNGSPGTTTGATTATTAATTGATTAATTGATTAATTGATTGATTSSTIGAGKSGCEVTDTGGIDDRSFNATAYKGLTDAQTAYGITPKYLESKSQSDYAPNIQAFIGKCDLIVTVGFFLGDATSTAAKANPDQKFSIVDFAYDPTIKNVLGLTFSTDQAAFLAGYVAAGTTESGTVATFGGANIPTVTIFMQGFAAGIRKFNQDNGTSVKLLGWDPEKQNGTFTGDFEDQNKGKQVTQQFLSEGADIVMPVAGPVGLGAAAAVEDANQGGQKAMLIGVDTDWYVSAPDFQDIELTSVVKNMDVAVKAAMEAVLTDKFKGGIYTGTLANNGVGIAPFHNFESAVPDTVTSQLDTLKQGIVDGSISVDPTDYPA